MEVFGYMRVLFLQSGTIWVHTLPEGFIEAGHEIKISGPINNENVSAFISEFKPHLIISMGMGPDQTKERQLIARKYSKAYKIPHVYWSIEDPCFTRSFSLPIIQTMQPDFVFSICPETVDYFNQMGIKSAYMNFGFAPKIHHPIEALDEYTSSIALVANAYPHVLKRYPNHYRKESIKTLILPILKKNIKIDFWGDDWDKFKEILGFSIPNEWIHGYLPYKDANKVYSSSKIIIGLQNYTTQVTQRTFEVLASGGFLLTNDTPGVNNLFKKGEDLITSSSPENTLGLVKYYLDRPKECIKIALNATKTVAGNSYKDRAQYIINTLKKEKIIGKDIC